MKTEKNKIQEREHTLRVKFPCGLEKELRGNISEIKDSIILDYFYPFKCPLHGVNCPPIVTENIKVR